MKRPSYLTVPLLAVLFLGWVLGRTTQTQGKSTVYGQGNSSCGTWIQDKQSDSRAISLHAIDRAWVGGFVSGSGHTGLQLRKTDSNGIVAFMDTYCQAHPLENISLGAAALVDALLAR
jgi:hypothetical protein